MPSSTRSSDVSSPRRAPPVCPVPASHCNPPGGGGPSHRRYFTSMAMALACDRLRVLDDINGRSPLARLQILLSLPRGHPFLKQTVDAVLEGPHITIGVPLDDGHALLLAISGLVRSDRERRQRARRPVV